MERIRADVCVVGAGLAGISAALAGAEQGASVVLLTDGRPCGGSSFQGGTWGLGMVLPADRTPEASASLAEKVIEVGLGCSNDAVVRSLCDQAWDCVDWLQGLGVALQSPGAGHERDTAYVPCFDTEVRGWRLFPPRQAEGPMLSALDRAGVRVLDAHAVSLLGEPGRVSGVLGAGADGLVSVRSRATVLATGGTAGVCSSCLTLPSLEGDGAALAIDAGAEVRGLEFIQVMAGVERNGARPLVCNEKVWRATTLTGADGRDAFEAAGIPAAEARAALEAHSVHGPFTVERVSRLVEQAIAHATATGGCWASTDLRQLEGQELVEDFASWLRDMGVDPAAPLPVRLYAQAANGGIVVDTQGRTTVRGLYAAGECAQVYGADRLGGMASVMALTLGRAAGTNAANERAVEPLDGGPLSPLSAALVEPNAREGLKRTADRALLGPRTTRGLEELLAQARSLQARAEKQAVDPHDLDDLGAGAVGALRKNATARQQAAATAAIAKACLGRRESLGPHWRQG